MRWPWAPGKILGVVTLACFLAVAVLARVDAARHPEREWKPSLAELPNPSAAPLPELLTSPVPVESVGASRSDRGAEASSSLLRRLKPATATPSRSALAQKYGKLMESALAELNMAGTRFQIRVERQPDQRLSEGMDLSLIHI